MAVNKKNLLNLETLTRVEKVLLFKSTLATLLLPIKRTLEAFYWYFFNGDPIRPDSFPTLSGHSYNLFDDVNDFIALRMAEDQDRLTIFI